MAAPVVPVHYGESILAWGEYDVVFPWNIDPKRCAVVEVRLRSAQVTVSLRTATITVSECEHA